MLQFLTMSKSLVFMGSPEFAAIVLRALSEHYSIKGVITQPDKPAGRGKIITSPAVKILAEQLQIPVIQPRRLKEPEVIEQINAWKPDAIVVAAFGQILRKNVLDLPPFGCINVHASLLPRWRGASPIQAAILAGDVETGVTIMKMDEGIDTGDILKQERIPIPLDDTTQSLTIRLGELGARLLLETLPEYFLGNISTIKQDESLATYAPMIKKEQAVLELHRPARELVNAVRAYQPWPVARVVIRGQELLLHQAAFLADPQAVTGQEYRVNRNPALGTGDGLLILQEVQLPGKKKISGKDFLNGIAHWGLQT
jgi:methionyl-tRNA formyltransferase